MAKIKWDEDGQRFYETGVKNCVLYLKKNKSTGGKPYDKGVAWNGITSISENPSGAEATKLYADDRLYLNLTSAEEFGATVEAYTYPDEFAVCDGSAELMGSSGSTGTGVFFGQQNREVFGLCYRTVMGNDENGNDKGYKLHLVYGAKAAPSSKAYATVNDSPEAITFSWELTTTPVEVTGYKPTACITIDSTKADSSKLEDLLEILYGTDGASEGQGTDARLPLPDEVATIFGVTVSAG